MRAIAEIAVLDIFLLDAGALDRVLDGVGRHRHWRGNIEPAAAGLRQPGTCIGNDNSFTHFADLPLIPPSMDWTSAPVYRKTLNSGGRKSSNRALVPRRP